MNTECHFIPHMFHFEQHITKTFSIIAYTLSIPCSQVFQCLPRHVFWYRWIFFRIAIFRSSMFRHLVDACTLSLWSTRKGNTQAERSGERAGHGFLPRTEITCSGNISQTTSMDAVAVWADASMDHLAGTIWSRAQFQDDSVLAWGSSIAFQHN
jgi:hypothetical protein